jgi:hypothetical protein
MEGIRDHHPRASQAFAGWLWARVRAATRLAQGLLDSPKVKDVGGFDDERGLYMILDDVNADGEITEILGPEIFDNGYVEVHPIVSVERLGELFRQWAEQGR